MNLTDATWALVDTETSGTEPGDDLLEVACHLYSGLGTVAGERFSSLVRPTKPIPPEASGVHGLTDEDFDDAPARVDVLAAIATWLPADAIIVAHHAEFDLRVLGWEDWPAVCSARLAHHMTPEAPNFKLATLRYYYGYKHLPVGAAHRADADLVVLAPVFFYLVMLYRAWASDICGDDTERLAKAETVEALIATTKRPYLLARPAFGKHKTWAELFADPGYLRWMIRLPDLSPEMRYSIQAQRGALAI